MADPKEKEKNKEEETKTSAKKVRKQYQTARDTAYKHKAYI